MFYLWKEGEVGYSKCIPSSGLDISDKSHLDGVEFDYVTSIDCLHGNARRISGLYRYKTAEAVVRSKNAGHLNMVAEAQSKFVKLEDAKILFQLISAGKIWPELNYEDAQLPCPTRHLRELLREAWGIIRRSVSNRFYNIRHTS